MENNEFTRFFLVSYTYFKDGLLGFGQSDCTTKGNYMNRDLFNSQVKEKLGVQSVVILNIIELSKSDYEDYYAKTEEQ